MKYNWELMWTHLKQTLCLNTEHIHNDTDLLNDNTTRLALNSEILDVATQFELPIFISIDASLKEGYAISSVSIVIPDI